jgi:phage tail-like protein
MASDDIQVGVCFAVKIDDNKIGVFSTCEGLGVEVVMEQREEGGNNTMIWQLPTRMKYTNIKLSRPIGKDSHQLIDWITKALQGAERSTAVIEAKSVDGNTLATWSLSGVVPVRWTGPSLNLDSPKVFTETLEIAHHGFNAS